MTHQIINYATTARVHLPAHVLSEQVFEVILRVMNYTFKQVGKKQYIRDESNPIKRGLIEVPFDKNIASSSDNYWTLELSETDAKTSIVTVRLDEHDLKFRNILGDYMSYKYFSESEGSSKELEVGEKRLYPYSDIMGCSIGKRLVDFFGGKLLYRECTSDDDEANWYHNSNPKYNPKDYNSEDRRRVYANLLYNEEILTLEDVEEMITKALMPPLFEDDLNNKVLEYFKKQKLAQNLSESLLSKSKATTTKI